MLNSFDNGCPATEINKKPSAKRIAKNKNIQKDEDAVDPNLTVSATDATHTHIQKSTQIHNESPRGAAYKKLAQISKSILVGKQGAVSKNAKIITTKKYNKRHSVGEQSLQFREPKRVVESPGAGDDASQVKKSLKTSDFIHNIKLKLATMKSDKPSELTESPQVAGNSGNKASDLRQKLKQSATAKYTTSTITTIAMDQRNSERCINNSERFGPPAKDLPQTGSQTIRLKTITSKYQPKTRKTSITSQDNQIHQRRTTLNKSSFLLIDKMKQNTNRSTSRKDERSNKSTLKDKLPHKHTEKAASLGVSSTMLSKIVSKIAVSKNNSFVHE